MVFPLCTKNNSALRAVALTATVVQLAFLGISVLNRSTGAHACSSVAAGVGRAQGIAAVHQRPDEGITPGLNVAQGKSIRGVDWLVTKRSPVRSVSLPGI